MEGREEQAEDGERVIQSKEEDSIGKLLELIPLDLIPDILLRLPAKSAVRFRCVSKLWSSITTRPYLITSFAFTSSNRLRLLVCIKTSDRRRLFVSLPQHEHPHTSYSDVERYQMDPPEFDTGKQHVTLPEPAEFRFKSYFLGYDLVEDKYKVFCIASRTNNDPLSDKPKHYTPRWPMGHRDVCINGHVYYEARISFEGDDITQWKVVLVSFDVRYEKFRIIRKPDDPNFSWVCEGHDEKKLASSLRFWILEDEGKQEWSLRDYLMPFQIWPRRDPIWRVYLSLDSVIQDTGEFIYVEAEFEAIYVIYYDPKTNRTRRVIYEGVEYEEFTEYSGSKNFKVHLYPNHSESLMSLEKVPRYASPINWDQ
ncbi:hypothetical protein Bca4012_056650 [Brassica carinata]